MEYDDDHQPTSQKSIDGDNQGGSKVIITRSYECNFCKRGFSNAQALGGHMNIHRKDKAKLKQTSNSSNQAQPSSLDNINLHKVPPLMPFNVSSKDDADDSSRDETHVVPIKQLPLFDDSPRITSETHKPQSQALEEITHESGIRVFPSSQGSSLELDLELRLGPDPEDSSAKKGTRKFF
ncbi:hypothetical protein RIF29_27830 [Crotalaria pallida]|uniref:C2H2-type domain-containing protein n=1 Tax=Crotalaria pallida TaxID=3830 RepID=A0AAN9EQG9_CROPI